MKRAIPLAVVIVALIGSGAALAVTQRERPFQPLDNLYSLRLDMECMYNEGTTSGALICYRRTEPKESAYVMITPTWIKILKAQGGGLVTVKQYRR